jgi:threonine aldolase
LAVQLPPPPDRSFASDNAAGAHPSVIAAIAAANSGHALAYGDDDWTRRCTSALHDLFGGGQSLLAVTGTGANILGLLTMLRPVDAVVCASGAHINVDEAGAAERILGAKLIDLPSPDGKIHPDQLGELAAMRGNEHHVQPAVLSLTQSTELGTLYTADELGSLCDRAHALGLRVHVDGARLANAVAATTADADRAAAVLRSMTTEAGADIVTFGGTKNGLVAAEAVVFLDPALAERAKYARKTVTQLVSKMRFLAAQFSALLDDDLWFHSAAHANAAAYRLWDAVRDLPNVTVERPAVNSLFPVLAPEAIAPLRDWSYFWDWDPARNQVRWMTSWDTTDEDIERFVAGVTAVTQEVATDH